MHIPRVWSRSGSDVTYLSESFMYILRVVDNAAVVRISMLIVTP